MVLAGLWYRDLVTTNQDEPGDVEGWEIYQDDLGEGLAYFDPEGDGLKREPYDPKQGTRILSRHFNIDNFLAAQGLNLDHQSRTRLIEHVAQRLLLRAACDHAEFLGSAPDLPGHPLLQGYRGFSRRFTTEDRLKSGELTVGSKAPSPTLSSLRQWSH